MSTAPAILNIHTPSSSFAIVHSFAQDSLQTLYDTLSRKAHTSYHGERVGPGWLKYEFNDAIWNLDDDSDYTIFVWRQHQPAPASTPTPTPSATTDSNKFRPPPAHTPTLYLHNPSASLPGPSDYRNPSYYLYRPNARRSSPAPSTRSKKSTRKDGSRHTSSIMNDDDDGIPKHKKDFEKFHGENGVRTVMGSIGPVHNVRMLLRAGHRHVYISRKFAIKHGFIPKDAAPGHYGYGGLVNIGTWPVTLTPSSTFNAQPDAPVQPNGAVPAPKEISIGVFLSEEPHFDGQNDIDPPPYVSVVTRNNDTIFYSDTDTIEVAPPIPKAVSKPLVRMEAFQRSPSVSSESRAVQTSPVTDASILGIMLSRTSSSRSSTMDLLETSFPFSNEDDDEPPCSTPPTQDIPSLNVEEEAPDSEPALPAEFDITVLWRLSNLPFAQDIEEEPPSTPLSRPEHSIGRDSPLPVEVFAEPNFTAPLTSTLSFPEDPHSNLGNLGVHPEEEALMEDLQVTESVAPQISTPSCDLKSRQDLQEVPLREVSFQNDTEAEDEPSSRMEGPVVPLDVSASTSVFASSGKIQLPRARPTTSLARPMTVSGDIHSWNIEPQHGEGVVSFAFGRSDADLAHAISTSLPRVIDLGGTGMIEDEGRSR
ncbi:hypothetical protein H0H93_013838 [Arthromyces matolae]|nr:hypothetical protein H0H93_013838 [Arthromyces matolae]